MLQQLPRLPSPECPCLNAAGRILASKCHSRFRGYVFLIILLDKSHSDNPFAGVGGPDFELGYSAASLA
jgi:hypothetical protein